MQQQNQKTVNPGELAKMFEPQIKRVVSEKFSVAPDDLETLIGDKDGAYLSKEEADTLCCLVVGRKSKFLYLVAGKIAKDGKDLTNLRADIVS